MSVRSLLFVHFSGAPGKGGHCQTIEPNGACLAKYRELTATVGKTRAA